MEWMTPALVASLDDYLRQHVDPACYDVVLDRILKLLAADSEYYLAMGWRRVLDKVLW